MHTLDHNSRLLDAHHERPDEPGTSDAQIASLIHTAKRENDHAI